MDSKSKDSFTDAAFLEEPVLIDLFIRYNTAIPSSAAVERLFLQENMFYVRNDHRCRMTILIC